jgi:hypothetical protein
MNINKTSILFGEKMIKFSKYYRSWFKQLWKNNANEYQFFELATKIVPSINFEYFDHGWQYRTILHENYKTAKEEFLNVLIGCH